MTAAHSPALKKAFQDHLIETQNQISRLEQIFSALGEKPGGETCGAMKGLLQEGEKMIENTDEGEVRDAGLIAAAQRVEHYEMAGYGSTREFADVLSYPTAVSLLDRTLAEEKNADAILNGIAIEMVNMRALSASGTGTGKA
jgi:ferritin-like metal-binding protein YciE